MATFQCCPTGKPVHQYYNLISHSVTLSFYWASQCLPYPNNAERLARKWEVSNFKSLLRLDQGSDRLGSDSPISQNVRRTLYSFGDPMWLVCVCDVNEANIRIRIHTSRYYTTQAPQYLYDLRCCEDIKFQQPTVDSLMQSPYPHLHIHKALSRRGSADQYVCNLLSAFPHTAYIVEW